jgi:hypothetical protein
MPLGAGAGGMPAPPQMMPQPMPPMPSPEQLEEDKLIAEACSWEEISSVLHSDDRRNYNVDVETDATAFEDAEVEKQSRIEYVRAMTEMMQLWIPAIQSNPSLAPFAKELAIFGSGAFKPGRQFEEQLGDAFDQIQNMPPQPNPEAEKLKAEAGMDKARFQMDMELKKADLQGKQQASQIATAGKQADLQAQQQSTQMDMRAKQLDLQLKQVSAQLDIMLKKMQMGIEQEKLGLEREKTVLDAQAAREKAEIDRDSMVFEANMQRQASLDKREEQMGTSPA